MKANTVSAIVNVFAKVGEDATAPMAVMDRPVELNKQEVVALAVILKHAAVNLDEPLADTLAWKFQQVAAAMTGWHGS